MELMEDLDSAIDAVREAAELTPVGHPNRSMYLNNLALTWQRRFEKTGSSEELNCTIAAYEESTNVDTAPPSVRVAAAYSCADLLISQQMLTHAKSILETAVDLLPSLSPRHLKDTDARFNISQFANLTARAVSLCLAHMDDLYGSLQLLEHGRGILANLRLEVRSDISVLGTEHPELAQRFQQLRDAIDSAPRTFELGIIEHQTIGVNSASNFSALRILSNQFDDLLKHIRSLRGFDNFLKGPLSSETELHSLAKVGPIVVFNISDIRSDAFLITRDEIRSVHLPLLTSELVNRLATLFLEATNENDTDRPWLAARKMNHILRSLWDCGVKTILDELGFIRTPSPGQPWSRIWWVGSGLLNLLPIHAAGYHDLDPPQSVVDRAISSYAFTLKSLSYAREKEAKADIVRDNALILAMPTTSGQASLRFVEDEVRNITKLFSNTSIVTKVIINPTRAQALSELPKHSIVHFTCHGHSKEDPSRSCFLLEDWKLSPLTVRDITLQNIDGAKFAFLSACHSAAGRNFHLLDESINLSSAIQLAGFPAVVGTLWAVDERTAAEVAGEVYTMMIERLAGLDIQRSGESLHKAALALRKKTRIFGSHDPLRWVPYIHIGI